MPSTTAGGYGTPKPMNLVIHKCQSSTYCTNPPASDSDSGNFSYYAGPVSVTAPNNCIVVAGNITYNGKIASASSGISHC